MAGTNVVPAYRGFGPLSVEMAQLPSNWLATSSSSDSSSSKIRITETKLPKKCFPLIFSILGHKSTRALQSSPFQISGGGPLSLKDKRKKSSCLIYDAYVSFFLFWVEILPNSTKYSLTRPKISFKWPKKYNKF